MGRGTNLVTADRPADDLREQLAFELEDRPDTHIYVASALTALESAQRSHISHRCEIIDQTIVATSGSTGPAWQVHLPVVWSAPKPDDDRSPRKIYKFNRGHVRRASGLVLLGDHGGSLGAGQEFAWALARRLPVLVILGPGSTLSRQIAGTPALLCIRDAPTDADLRLVVAHWVSEWGPAVESRARGGTGERIIAIRAAERLYSAFTESVDSIEAICAIAGLTPERTQELFDPEALLDGSVSELIALSRALGLEPGDALNPQLMPELSASQQSGLATAAHEYDWTPLQILQVESRARLELAKGGIRRLPLASVQDWITFVRSLDLV